MPSSNVSSTDACTVEPRVATKLYDEDEPPTDSSMLLMLTLVSLTNTVRVANCPSNRAVRVTAPVPSARRRLDDVVSTEESFE